MDNRNDISDKVIIATATLYNPRSESDIIRAELAKKFLRNANNLGYKTVVVDGGSSDELLTEFEKLGASVYSQKSKGMGNGKREAIAHTLRFGKEIIIWTEPEKEDYIKEIAKTVIPIVYGNADFVVPKRKSLDSYPIFQQYTETAGNLFWKETTGYDLDVFFGPRAWKQELSWYFLDYKDSQRDIWEVFYLPLMDAILNGKRVVGVGVDYTHPKIQKEYEEHNLSFHKKRAEQLLRLVEAIEFHWNKLNYSG